MISREQIKQTVSSVRELGGSMTLYYLPESSISTPEKTYGIYYSGRRKIEIGEYYSHSKLIKISDENFEEIIDDIYIALKDDIGDFIQPALDNLKLGEAEALKYFDRDLELFKKFRAEVLRLKKESK